LVGNEIGPEALGKQFGHPMNRIGDFVGKRFSQVDKFKVGDLGQAIL